MAGGTGVTKSALMAPGGQILCMLSNGRASPHSQGVRRGPAAAGRRSKVRWPQMLLQMRKGWSCAAKGATRGFAREPDAAGDEGTIRASSGLYAPSAAAAMLPGGRAGWQQRARQVADGNRRRRRRPPPPSPGGASPHTHGTLKSAPSPYKQSFFAISRTAGAARRRRRRRRRPRFRPPGPHGRGGLTRHPHRSPPRCPRRRRRRPSGPPPRAPRAQSRRWGA